MKYSFFAPIRQWFLPSLFSRTKSNWGKNTPFLFSQSNAKKKKEKGKRKKKSIQKAQWKRIISFRSISGIHFQRWRHRKLRNVPLNKSLMPWYDWTTSKTRKHWWCVCSISVYNLESFPWAFLLVFRHSYLCFMLDNPIWHRHPCTVRLATKSWSSTWFFLGSWSPSPQTTIFQQSSNRLHPNIGLHPHASSLPPLIQRLLPLPLLRLEGLEDPSWFLMAQNISLRLIFSHLFSSLRIYSVPLHSS